MHNEPEKSAASPIVLVGEEKAPLCWFAIQVRRKAERYVSDILARKGYECFSPMLSADGSRRISKKDLTNLFPGYVFCRLEAVRRLPILMTPGVIGIVSVGRVPAPIDDEEISSLQEALRRRLTIRNWNSVPIGSIVRVESGPMAGMSGRSIGAKGGRRLLITITLLQRSVIAEVDEDHVLAEG